MVTLSDFNSAARIREAIRAVTLEILEEVRPAPRYATVTAVNESLNKATVKYPDEVATFQVPYGSAIPAVGSTVRIVGQTGAKYIEDVTTRAQTVPAGLCASYVGTTAPAGWALVAGNTITNAQTLHPDLWAACPVAWRSGANLIMPDGRGRVTAGYSGSSYFATIGSLAGTANSNMPDHYHWTGDHTHNANHAHTAGSGTVSADHVHYGSVGTGEFLYRDGAYNTGYNGPHISVAGGGVAITWNGGTSGISTNHTHGITVNGNNFNVSYMVATHGGQIGTSTVVGGATATDTNYQPFIVLCRIIKL
jgi:hypothetical protein